MNEKARILKDKANTLPTTPGVYIMKNKKNETHRKGAKNGFKC